MTFDLTMGILGNECFCSFPRAVEHCHLESVVREVEDEILPHDREADESDICTKNRFCHGCRGYRARGETGKKFQDVYLGTA